jgi:CheY-like chemotaxis protein
MMDPTQLEQVIANLAVNARDAMPEGGRLSIETTNVVFEAEYAVSHQVLQPGEYVLLIVSDTGIGMSEEVKAHIFEPFFTTKEKDRGTGLGLATVYGIVKQSGGHIWVESREGQGSIFQVYLPRAREPVHAPIPPVAMVDMPSGNEVILLVEDDEGVRDLARRVLQRQGYTVLEAQNGQAALQVSAGHPGSIHLLLTDLVMPGISGKILAERLAETHPDLKVLFISGYIDDSIGHHSMLEPGVVLLQKPFSPVDLARQVRVVLDGQG